MTDTEHAAYDAANKEIERLKDELWEYKGLAKQWRDIAVRLMAIERAHRRIEGNVE